MNLIEFIHSHSKLRDAEEIIFFGGSFNPWHAGHEECVNRASSFAPVIIIPDNNPFKSYDKKLNRSPSINKIDQIVDEKNIFLFLGFNELQESNPTNTWIKPLKKQLNKKLSLLMGFDSFMSIPKWFEASDLLMNLSGIYVLSRLEQEVDARVQQSILLSSNPQINIQFLGRHEHEHLSSTKLRD